MKFNFQNNNNNFSQFTMMNNNQNFMKNNQNNQNINMGMNRMNNNLFNQSLMMQSGIFNNNQGNNFVNNNMNMQFPNMMGQSNINMNNQFNNMNNRPNNNMNNQFNNMNNRPNNNMNNQFNNMNNRSNNNMNNQFNNMNNRLNNNMNNQFNNMNNQSNFNMNKINNNNNSNNSQQLKKQLLQNSLHLKDPYQIQLSIAMGLNNNKEFNHFVSGGRQPPEFMKKSSAENCNGKNIDNKINVVFLVTKGNKHAKLFNKKDTIKDMLFKFITSVGLQEYHLKSIYFLFNAVNLNTINQNLTIDKIGLRNGSVVTVIDLKDIIGACFKIDN